MRHLGVDLGSRRIGLAISDPAGRIASPHKQLPATGDLRRDADAILAEAGAAGAGAIVLGLPVNMNGTVGPMAEKSQAFAAILRRRGGPRVHLFDERLTSYAADGVMDAAGWTNRGTRRRRHRDMLAAQAMLQTFLDQQVSADGE